MACSEKILIQSGLHVCCGSWEGRRSAEHRANSLQRGVPAHCSGRQIALTVSTTKPVEIARQVQETLQGLKGEYLNQYFLFHKTPITASSVTDKNHLQPHTDPCMGMVSRAGLATKHFTQRPHMRREGTVERLLSLLALTSLCHFNFHFLSLPESQYLQLGGFESAARG